MRVLASRRSPLAAAHTLFLMPPSSPPTQSCFVKVQDISDAVHTTKVLRRTIVWPTIILALVFVALFTLISCTTYEAVACARPSCRAPCTGGFAPFVVFLAVVVYLCAASTISLSGEIPLYVLTIALSYLYATPVRRAVAWRVERLFLSLQCLQRSLLQAPRGLAWRLLDTGWLPVHSATGPIAHTDSLVKYRHLTSTRSPSLHQAKEAKGQQTVARNP